MKEISGLLRQLGVGINVVAPLETIDDLKTGSIANVSLSESETWQPTT